MVDFSSSVFSQVPELNWPVETLTNTEAEHWGQGKEANKVCGGV